MNQKTLLDTRETGSLSHRPEDHLDMADIMSIFSS